ncbi:MAG: rRNA maturation RNase YbeY [Nitrospinae bacterium]|nr:rRNA maturation RNase YbeY [Nitrospinota bacterium]
MGLLGDLDEQDSELSIIFVDDQEIKRLNKIYRGVEMPTDVLSFSQREGDFSEINPQILGDIVISIDTALRQAQDRGHSLEEEIYILTVHGFLHLIGYDHEISPEYARIMREKEEEILKC